MGLLDLQLPLFLLLTVHGANSSVYSCEEVRYRLINSTFAQTTKFACVITQEGFSNWDQLERVYAQDGHVSTSLSNIALTSSHCIEHTTTNSQWRISAEISGLDCKQEFTLILTSEKPEFIMPLRQEERYLLEGSHVLAVPQAGMWIHKRRCVGSGNVTLWTGAGTGVEEDRFEMKTWLCATLPDWIFSFDDVITIQADSVAYTMECSSLLELDALVMALPCDRVAVLTSGRSDDLQNLEGSGKVATVLIGEWESHEVSVDMHLTFDPSNTGAVVLQKTWGGPEFRYYNGTYSEKFMTNFFEVRYSPKYKQASEIWSSQDNIIIELSIDSKDPATPAPTTEPENQDPYCNCAVDASLVPLGWKYDEIWLDIVVILDASETMGQQALDEASSLTESLLSDGISSLLNTDPTLPFFTRVGVILMGDKPQVLFNLNLTKADKVQGKAVVQKGLVQMDIYNAFDAALIMLSNGVKTNPERANTRQVVYYMTDSEVKDQLISMKDFKALKGVIIVNNFLHDEESEHAGLKQVASEGYYFTKSNYRTSLQAFCKANCFCTSDKTSYGGVNPAILASAGCYSSMPAASFGNAKAKCSSAGGIVATIHDEDKGRFVQQVLPKSSSDYFWIGYSKSDDGTWQWEDQSTDPYTNWGPDEPSNAPVAKCAYAYSAANNLSWGAGNCNLAFLFVCQYAPCSAGHKGC